MPKRLLDVGNCGSDHAALGRIVQKHFEAEIDQAHGLADALAALDRTPYDLVTVNRLMDADGSTGLEIVKAIRENSQLSQTTVMLISNYAEYQDLAVKHGAVRGFGKHDLRSHSTVDLLRDYLG